MGIKAKSRSFLNPGLCGALALAVPVGVYAQNRSASNPEQQATVVLFTPGGHWRGMGNKLNPFAGKAKTMSNGSIFDGEAFLATLTHSRYLVIRLEAGIHNLSASRLGDHANAKQAVSLNLRPGSISYFAVTTTVPSVLAGIAPLETSHISIVSCKELQAELRDDHLDPVDLKQVGEAYKLSVNEHFDFSVCKF